MKKYRCTEVVEAMRWFDTDENREAFADWFEANDAVFETRGPIVCLPEGDHNHVAPGEWIVLIDDEFTSMGDECFVESYEAVQS